jgi:hypothetical protein
MSDRSNIDAAWQRLLRGVSRAARKEAPGRTIAKLAWTAGPVTFLALQGGYLIGYGELAPRTLWLYFGAYTIITGVVALTMRFVYNATRGEQLEEGRAALTDLMTMLPDLILQGRDENLAYFDQENRRVLAAWELLDDPDASPTAVRTAIEMVTGSPILAESAARIEAFRRRGLAVLVGDEQEAVRSTLTSALERLAESSPQLAGLIEQRFDGKAPQMSRGRIRTAGFIERILTAGEREDYTLMTLKDAEEAFVLALELLVGRRFPYVVPEYIGGKSFMDASRALDRARRAYRSAVYARNSRLRILMELLAQSDAVQQVAPTMAHLTDPAVNSRNVFLGLNQEIQRLGGRRLRPEPAATVRAKAYRLRKAVELYRQFYRQNQITLRRYEELAAAERRYGETREKRGKHFTPKLLSAKDRGYGIRIRKQILELPEEQRLDLARDIRAGLPDSIDDRPDVKQAAFGVLAELSRRLNLNRWDLQFAIETSNASYLACLDPSLTAHTRAGWIVSMATDVRWEPIRALRRLTSMLVSYHEMNIDQESIEQLAAEFDVPSDELYVLHPESEPMRVERAKSFVRLELPPPQPDWERTLRKATAAR